MNFYTLLWTWMGLAVLTFFVLLKVRAPYGRHTTKSFGPQVSNKWGWFWMEMPALLTFPLLTLLGPNKMNILSWILVSLWLIHYVNRTLIFPFRLKTKGKKMPLAIVISAIFFNLINGFFNGYYLGFMEGSSPTTGYILAGIGIFVFFLGYFINHWADNFLIKLREKSEGYQIPRGGLFNYISCPNHFGEIIEWTGFAIVACSAPAASFALWTFCNLAPRAFNHHQWYQENFPDYPKERKAVLPFVR